MNELCREIGVFFVVTKICFVHFLYKSPMDLVKIDKNFQDKGYPHFHTGFREFFAKRMLRYLL